jgi:hypothetical protein
MDHRRGVAMKASVMSELDLQKQYEEIRNRVRDEAEVIGGKNQVVVSKADELASFLESLRAQNALELKEVEEGLKQIKMGLQPAHLPPVETSYEVKSDRYLSSTASARKAKKNVSIIDEIVERNLKSATADAFYDSNGVGADILEGIDGPLIKPEHMADKAEDVDQEINYDDFEDEVWSHCYPPLPLPLLYSCPSLSFWHLSNLISHK